ncbi:hypothetical protein [Pseudomonas maumuensis]|uniref:Secreted protein n=1 Tax=Pseudomonas maumuensis TaxID=2842354 RepID=A0ABX8NS99_9PSED|nr:hypothetical protein [Pseudomonas maumuensis]QXH58886.1 hypothetical protein KSS90_11985 [Pseudomonas maumuensis]
MKTVAVVLTLLATISATSAFAEGGADRLKERSAQWALQRQQAEQVVKGDDASPAQQQVGREVRGNQEMPSS